MKDPSWQTLKAEQTLTLHDRKRLAPEIAPIHGLSIYRPPCSLPRQKVFQIYGALRLSLPVILGRKDCCSAGLRVSIVSLCS